MQKLSAKLRKVYKNPNDFELRVEIEVADFEATFKVEQGENELLPLWRSVYSAYLKNGIVLDKLDRVRFYEEWLSLNSSDLFDAGYVSEVLNN